MPTADEWLDLGPGIGTRVDRFRFDVLDRDLTVIGALDVRSDQPPVIENNRNRPIKRTLTLTPPPGVLDDLDLFADRIRPVMITPDGTEHPMGVFLFADLSQLRQTYGLVPQPGGVMLVDQSLILDQPLPESIYCAGGACIAITLDGLFADAGIPSYEIELTYGGTFNGGTILFPPGSSRLQAMNELAANAGAYSVFFDNDGVGRVRPVPDLDTPTRSYVDGRNIVAGSIIETNDTLSAPNRFIVLSGDGVSTDEPVVGVYDVPASAPHSAENRGYVVATVIQAQGIGNTVDADRRARVEADRSVGYEWVSFSSPVDPRHDTYDVVDFRGATYREQGWSITCQAGIPMTHELRRSYTGSTEDT